MVLTLYSKFFSKMTSCPQREMCKASKLEKIVPVNEVDRFIRECLEKLSVHKDKAAIFADQLITSDYNGIFSHGLSRLEHYINDIKQKACDPNADPVVTMECASTAAVCGNNGLGSVVGIFCMDLAIKKAKETGIGLVVANYSNHFGVNMLYTQRAAKQGLIGLAFTNTSPVMVPAGAKDVCLGTNPISLCAPGECDENLLIDMATTAVAVGKIEIYKRNNQKLPEGWALDDQGKITTDPEVAMKFRKLMPLGGDLQSYKGTALALIVECLSGLLADSLSGPNIRRWGDKKVQTANIGHGFIAIDVEKFPPGFRQRLSNLTNFIRNMEPADPSRPVLVPGDIERKLQKTIDEQGGIIYTPSHLEMVDKLSKELEVKPLQFL